MQLHARLLENTVDARLLVNAADERLWVHVVGQLGGLPFVAGRQGRSRGQEWGFAWPLCIPMLTIIQDGSHSLEPAWPPPSSARGANNLTFFLQTKAFFIPLHIFTSGPATSKSRFGESRLAHRRATASDLNSRRHCRADGDCRTHQQTI